MYIGKFDAAPDQQCLDGLLGRLLDLKAQFFQIDMVDATPRQGKIASGAIQPLPRVIGKRLGGFINHYSLL